MKQRRELLIDAINPNGSLAFLTEHFYQVIRDYLNSSDQRCLTEAFHDKPIELRELTAGSKPKGSAYKLRISLED